MDAAPTHFVMLTSWLKLVLDLGDLDLAVDLFSTS